MPDRIVRQNILTSDPVNTLSWPAEVFYRRLMSIADDFGRCEARASILRAHLYPLKLDKVSDSDVVKWMGECSKAGLLRSYRVDNKDYLEIFKFGQRLRAFKSKYPAPDNIGGNSLSNVGETLSNVGSRPPETKRNESEKKGNEKPQAAAGDLLIKKSESLFPAHFSPQFSEEWVLWKKFKKEEFRFEYKSIDSETAAISELLNLAKNNETLAREIIKKSKANGWKGFFELENEAEVVKKKAQQTPTVPWSDPVGKKISGLYQSYLMDQCTIVSVEVNQFDYLQKAGMIDFSESVAEEIKEEAERLIREKKLDLTAQNQTSFMKKLGVLQCFKQLKEDGKKIIFRLEFSKAS